MQKRKSLLLSGAALALLLATPTPSSAAPVKARVASIVFIGKAKACPCTKKSIADAWKALQAGLGKRRIPVRRIQTDVKPAEVDRYKKKRAYKVLPTLYFLTSAGKVIDLLQGIVTTADVKQALKGR